jgi:Subunit 11 of the general transcription factor TFIIH
LAAVIPHGATAALKLSPETATWAEDPSEASKDCNGADCWVANCPRIANSCQQIEDEMDIDRVQPPLLPSPAPSSPSTARTLFALNLPPPRGHPLKPGSQKEVAFIIYVDSKILQINRRYAKKFSSDGGEADEEARGYDDFEDVVEDLEHVLDAVWVSGTRKPKCSLEFKCFCNLLRWNWLLMQMSLSKSGEPTNHPPATLQIPYLLSLAGLFSDFLPAFPFVEAPTIRLIDKIDQAFATLLSQQSYPLASNPGDGNNFLVSITDRVRIRSITETTRITAVEAATNTSVAVDVGDVSESFTDTENEEFARPGRSRQALNMSISKMYKRSLSILGGSLG